MASSGRVYHQDYIARIRYSNTLPPPPNPPKLLEIPNTGLASGQYTSAGFASRLAREQPLNIEADAELGMPIDLVGLPGLFDGDDSVILASENPVPLHPHDRALLRPLNALGKPSSMAGGVSFLRRTEYMTAAGGGGHSGLRDHGRVRQAPRKKKQTDAEKNEPINILRSILKGFDLEYPEDAYKGPDTTQNLRAEEITPEEKRAWLNPKHPTNPELKLLDAYPLLPDLDGLPEAGNYVVTKFQTNPATQQGSGYDDRIDVGVLRVLEPDAEQEERNKQLAAEAEADPTRDVPPPEYDYELFLPTAHDAVRGIKRKFSTVDAENDDPSFYSHETADTGKRFFRYDRVRAYETYQQTGNAKDSYDDTVAIVLHDPETDVGAAPGAKSRLQKAAYYYPVVQRTFIRPKRRTTNMPGQRQHDEEGDRVDVLEIDVREWEDGEMEQRMTVRAKYELEGEVDLS